MDSLICNTSPDARLLTCFEGDPPLLLNRVPESAARQSQAEQTCQCPFPEIETYILSHVAQVCINLQPGFSAFLAGNFDGRQHVACMINTVCISMRCISASAITCCRTALPNRLWQSSNISWRIEAAAMHEGSSGLLHDPTSSG